MCLKVPFGRIALEEVELRRISRVSGDRVMNDARLGFGHVHHFAVQGFEFVGVFGLAVYLWRAKGWGLVRMVDGRDGREWGDIVSRARS
jgi:hypothetical protein